MANEQSSVLTKLFNTIESRKQCSTQESYTASLFAQGLAAITDKVMEEASEVCEAANISTKDHLIYELADLFYHSLVLAAFKGIKFSEIEAELANRFGKSGLAEKASRNKKQD